MDARTNQPGVDRIWIAQGLDYGSFKDHSLSTPGWLTQEEPMSLYEGISCLKAFLVLAGHQLMFLFSLGVLRTHRFSQGSTKPSWGPFVSGNFLIARA